MFKIVDQESSSPESRDIISSEKDLVTEEKSENSHSCSCSSMNNEPKFIYAIGRLEPQFPNISITNEFRQAVGKSETKGKTNSQTFQSVISKKENKYIARKLCWVFSIEGVASFVVVPQTDEILNEMIESIRDTPKPTDIDVIIGRVGPMASPSMCNGLIAPIAILEQIYSFDIDSLKTSIPKAKGVSIDEFQAAGEELFSYIMKIADNSGSTDDFRALNYLVVRDPSIYAKTAEMHGKDYSLRNVETRQSRLSGARNILDIIFSYEHRQTTVVEKFYTRVDVTEIFPFLVTRLSPYYDH